MKYYHPNSKIDGLQADTFLLSLRQYFNIVRRRHYASRDSHRQQAGFTIIELLIATLIFSMVIIVILYGVLSFTHAYYSGVNASTTQDTARSIVDTITQSIEFSGSNISPTPSTLPAPGSLVTFCVGGDTFVYLWGVAYSNTTTLSAQNPGLYMTPGACGTYTIPSNSGRELLGNDMRITYLTVTQVPSNSRLFTIQLGLAYGDGDLLCNASKLSNPGGCLPNATLNLPSATVVGDSAYSGGAVNDVECRQTTGSQFCAHAGLSTTVSLRVTGSALN